MLANLSPLKSTGFALKLMSEPSHYNPFKRILRYLHSIIIIRPTGNVSLNINRVTGLITLPAQIVTCTFTAVDNSKIRFATFAQNAIFVQFFKHIKRITHVIFYPHQIFYVYSTNLYVR